MARGLFAANGNLDERITELANDREGPGVSFCAEHRFHLTDKSLGRQGRVVRRAAKDIFDQLRSRFDICIGSRDTRRRCRHRLWFHRIELLHLCLFAAQFELQAPAVRRLPRFTPQFERTNLGETGSEAYCQVHVAPLAEAQEGH